MITILYEDVLEDSEFDLVATVTCNKDALEWIDRCAPDLAIVDYLLPDGPCHPVIEKLQNLSVPVLVGSGYDEPPIGDLSGVYALEKPFLAEKLLQVLRAMSQAEERSTVATAHETGGSFES